MKRLALTLLSLLAWAPLLWADQADEYFKIGKDLYDQGNYHDSAVILEGVVRHKPDYWAAYEILGHDYVSLGDYQKALADCQKSLDLHPDNPSLLTFLNNLKTLPPPTPTPQAAPVGTPSGTVTPTANQNPSSQAGTPKGHPYNFFYVGLAGGADNPAKSWQSAYKAGPGGGLFIGMQLDKAWDVRLDLEGFYFSGTNYSGPIKDVELYVLPTLRYHFDGPYLLLSAGGEMELLSGNTGQPVSDFDLALGAGYEAELGRRTFVFVEGKYNFIFSPLATGNDVPVVAGVRMGL
jgi:tetratricopeptide (TPR) repeat protein